MGSVGVVTAQHRVRDTRRLRGLIPKEGCTWDRRRDIGPSQKRVRMDGHRGLGEPTPFPVGARVPERRAKRLS